MLETLEQQEKIYSYSEAKIYKKKYGRWPVNNNSFFPVPVSDTIKCPKCGGKLIVEMEPNGYAGSRKNVLHITCEKHMTENCFAISYSSGSPDKIEKYIEDYLEWEAKIYPVAIKRVKKLRKEIEQAEEELLNLSQTEVPASYEREIKVSPAYEILKQKKEKLWACWQQEIEKIGDKYREQLKIMDSEYLKIRQKEEWKYETEQIRIEVFSKTNDVKQKIEKLKRQKERAIAKCQYSRNWR